MSKLVCVECAPQPNVLGSNKRPLITPLTGFVGETLERYLRKEHDQDKIPVRFPLLGPGSHVSLLRGDRNVTDPYLLGVEGELIHKSSLYVLKDKVPVSTYTRVPLSETQDLFEKPIYSSTFSLPTFLSMLKQLRGRYPFSWIWKLEKSTLGKVSNSQQHIFMEARIYGIDAVINTYDANKFRGVAVEVIYRPQPTKEMIDRGIYVMRTCSDLHLFSNSEEYISYLDGVTISRESSDKTMVDSRYETFITPKIATRLHRFKEYYKKVLEDNNLERGLKVKEKVEMFNGEVPPPSKSKEERYSYAVGLKSMSTDLNVMYVNEPVITKTNGGS